MHNVSKEDDNYMKNKDKFQEKSINTCTKKTAFFFVDVKRQSVMKERKIY